MEANWTLTHTSPDGRYAFYKSAAIEDGVTFDVAGIPNWSSDYALVPRMTLTGGNLRVERCAVAVPVVENGTAKDIYLSFGTGLFIAATFGIAIIADGVAYTVTDGGTKRATSSLHEIPASDIHAGDVLLDDDYNPLGTISKAETLAGIVWLKCIGQEATNVFQLDVDDFVAVLRAGSAS